MTFSRRDSTIESLVKIGEPAVEPLINALKDVTVRDAAKNALADIQKQKILKSCYLN